MPTTTPAANVPAANQLNATVAVDNSIPNVASLSSSDVLAFCSASMNNINYQLQTEMTAQQNQGALASQWTKFAATLEQWTQSAGSACITGGDTGNGQAGMAQELMTLYSQTQDPTLQAAIGKAYTMVTGANISDAIAYAGKGSASAAAASTTYWTTQPGASNPACLASSFPPVAAGDWANEVQDVKDSGSTITQGSDLAMINIQNLVSQRQQVIELSTQMMQAFQEATSKITNNVGGQ